MRTKGHLTLLDPPVDYDEDPTIVYTAGLGMRAIRDYLRHPSRSGQNPRTMNVHISADQTAWHPSLVAVDGPATVTYLLYPSGRIEARVSRGSEEHDHR